MRHSTGLPRGTLGLVTPVGFANPGGVFTPLRRASEVLGVQLQFSSIRIFPDFPFEISSLVAVAYHCSSPGLQPQKINSGTIYADKRSAHNRAQKTK